MSLPTRLQIAEIQLSSMQGRINITPQWLRSNLYT